MRLHLIKKILKACLTEGASQVVLWVVLVLVGLAGFAIKDARVVLLSISFGLLFAALMSIARKMFERRHDPFFVSKLGYEFAMFEEGKKVRYTQELTMTALRPNLEYVRLRLAWSGDDSLVRALKDAPAPAPRASIQVHQMSENEKLCVFDVKFDTPLRKREKVTLKISVDLNEPNLSYKQFMAIGPAQYSYSVFPPTLTLRAIASEADTFEETARLSEYFHDTDFDLVRRQAVRVWEGKSLHREGTILEKKVWAFPQRSVYRFEFPTTEWARQKADRDDSVGTSSVQRLTDER